MRLAMGAAAVLAFAGAAQAATTRKVPQDYANIQAAEDAAQDGDTILVSKGRYILDATVIIDVPNLIVKGSGAIVDGARPNQDNDDVPCFYVSSAGVTITGFTFRNGTYQVDSDGANLLVTKCVFIDASDNAVNLSAGDGARVESCRFFGGEEAAVAAYVANAKFLKNTVRSFEEYGIRGSGAGARYESNAVSFIANNHALDNSSANNAVVLKNKIFNVGGYGIYMDGNDVVVDGNAIRMTDYDAGIYVDGSSPFVNRNKLSFVYGGIFTFNADGSQVLSNKIVDVHGASSGIEVHGDTMEVVGNSVKNGSYYSWGFYLYNRTALGGGTVDRNTAVDMTDAGFYFGYSSDTFIGMEVSNCVAVQCGSWDAPGFWIAASDGSTFTGLKAVGINNQGYYIVTGSDDNQFTKCSVTNVDGDGFRMQNGDGNTFTDCTATNCGGEGFDNRGTNTELVGGKYRGDRNDVANDANNSATITLTNVDKVSPGTPQSQVD